MHKRAKKAHDELLDRGFRFQWKAEFKPLRGATGRDLHVYHGPRGCIAILVDYGRTGWDLFTPVSDSNKIEDVFERLDQYVEKGP